MTSQQPTICADAVRRYDNDRFLCTLFAPEPARGGLLSLYAFNLELARVRELVSEPLLGQMRLQWWRDAVAAIYDGRPPRHPVAEAFAAAIHRYALPRLLIDRLIDARAGDLDDAAPASLPALVNYAERASATVFLLALEIVAASGEAERAAAADVGVAWALIGLARAMPFHAHAGRCYLPADLCRDAGVDVLAPTSAGSAEGVSVVLGAIVDKASHLLERARRQRERIAPEALPVLLPASLADLYLRRLRQSGYCPEQARVQKVGAARHWRLLRQRLRGRY